MIHCDLCKDEVKTLEEAVNIKEDLQQVIQAKHVCRRCEVALNETNMQVREQFREQIEKTVKHRLTLTAERLRK